MDQQHCRLFVGEEKDRMNTMYMSVASSNAFFIPYPKSDQASVNAPKVLILSSACSRQPAAPQMYMRQTSSRHGDCVAADSV